MIRDLDWSTKASNLVGRVSNLNADAADLIQEVRVTRQGRFFPGKMCTAFVHLRDGASEEVAQQIAAILGGRVVEPKAKQQPPPKQQPVPDEQLPGLGFKRCPAPPPRPSSSASRGASSAPVTPPSHHQGFCQGHQQGSCQGHHQVLLLDGFQPLSIHSHQHRQFL